MLGQFEEEDGNLGQLTRAGIVAGTPAYMSPEQLSGSALSARADIYGLGLVLRNMLWRPTGDQHVMTVIAQRLRAEADLPREPGVPSELRDLMLAMLRLDPEERPASADVVATTLDQILHSPARTSTPLIASSIPVQASERTASYTTIGIAAVGVATIAFIVLTRTATIGKGTALGPLAQGIGLMLAGILTGTLISRAIDDRRTALEKQVSSALTGSRDRSTLSRTMIFTVDAIVQQTSKLDATFLGATIIGMVREYDEAKESSDKQQALVRATDLLEKLIEKTSPWYVRNSKWVVAAASLVGLVSGASKLVGELGGLFH